MRNDYVGFSYLKQVCKARELVQKKLINKNMTIEEKTLIRIEVNNMNAKELFKKMKELGV